MFKRAVYGLLAIAALPCAAIAEFHSCAAAATEITEGAVAANDFVTAAAIDCLTVIATAKIGLERGNEREKLYSQQMIREYGEISLSLEAIVASSDMPVELPKSLDGPLRSKIDVLRETKAENFSAAFDRMQISSRKEAVSLFFRYSKTGANSKLRDWARQMLPMLHFHHVQALDLIGTR